MQRSWRFRDLLAATDRTVALVFDTENLADAVEGLWDDGIVSPLAALVAAQKSGIGKDLQVVGDGGLGQVHGLCQVADTRLASLVGGDDGEEAQSCGVGMGLEHGRQ